MEDLAATDITRKPYSLIDVEKHESKHLGGKRRPKLRLSKHNFVVASNLYDVKIPLHRPRKPSSELTKQPKFFDHNTVRNKRQYQWKLPSILEKTSIPQMRDESSPDFLKLDKKEEP